MKRLIFTTLATSIVICSFGQKNFGIKIYQNTDFFEIQYYDYDYQTVRKFQNVNFNRISLAVEFGTPKGYTHEVELLIPELSKSLDNMQYPMNYEFAKSSAVEGKGSSYSLRYELNKSLVNNTKRLCINLGIGINPYYVFTEYIPSIANVYYKSTESYGFAVNAIPRIKYKLSKRLSFDLNVPLKIYDLRGVKTVIKNPAIPINQQTAKDYSNIFFENAYTVRLGLLYTFK